MPKVWMRSTGRPGVRKRVDRKLVPVLTRSGGWVLEEREPDRPTTDPRDLSELSYSELRSLAKGQGLNLGRATKAEVLAALRAHARSTYQRRDLQAE